MAQWRTSCECVTAPYWRYKTAVSSTPTLHVCCEERAHCATGTGRRSSVEPCSPLSRVFHRRHVETSTTRIFQRFVGSNYCCNLLYRSVLPAACMRRRWIAERHSNRYVDVFAWIILFCLERQIFSALQKHIHSMKNVLYRCFIFTWAPSSPMLSEPDHCTSACMCVWVSAQKLKKCWSEIHITWC